MFLLFLSLSLSLVFFNSFPLFSIQDNNGNNFNGGGKRKLNEKNYTRFQDKLGVRFNELRLKRYRRDIVLQACIDPHWDR